MLIFVPFYVLSLDIVVVFFAQPCNGASKRKVHGKWNLNLVYLNSEIEVHEHEWFSSSWKVCVMKKNIEFCYCLQLKTLIFSFYFSINILFCDFEFPMCVLKYPHKLNISYREEQLKFL